VDDFICDSGDDDAAIAILLSTKRLLPAHRSCTRGGSQLGHAPNIARDFDEAQARLVSDYFSVEAVYPGHYFERRFRMSREVYDRVFN
jgi:hypothetical protein